jgi:transcriptional regulator with XRE-family HTH domain
VPVARSPVVRRRELGVLLRNLRTDAGLTVEDVARQLLCSPSKVSRMETGQRAANQRDIRDLCQLYQVTESQRDHLIALAKAQKEHAWWQPYDLPFALATLVGLEAAATRMSDYDPGVAPGLLQTPEYARAIHEGSFPRLSDPEIGRRLEVLVNRQAVLTRVDPAPPQYRAVIDEAALHRVIGGPRVMAAQLEYVVRASEQPNVTVQILPYQVGAHPALDSTFILLDFLEPVPPVVYVEGLVGQLYLERSQDVERYDQIFERLQSISLTSQRSADLMRSISARYKKELRVKASNAS